ncbi:hypothetical protein B5S33_g1161 [[Candida] boidinii]|nr:hypothetical protein B5S30_g462 [[Candida] boidinii]OWB82535.1 hypothetical protein B5S33_g1161 [[Candida] boidinii]GMG00136.1 unnamed protein product [[Candida] boidinii]
MSRRNRTDPEESEQRSKRARTAELTEETRNVGSPSNHTSGSSTPILPSSMIGNSQAKLTNAFVRAMIGMENKYSVITKTTIKSVYDAEKESLITIKWKSMLPLISEKFSTIFGLDLQALPSKRKQKEDQNKNSNIPDTQGKDKDSRKNTSGGGSSENDYILVSTLPQYLKDVLYQQYENDKFIKDSNKLKSLHDFRSWQLENKSEKEDYGMGLPRSLLDIGQQGVKFLIVIILAIHSNHMSKDGLMNILKNSFNIKCGDNDRCDILNSLTISEFLDQLSKQEYIIQTITNNNSNSTQQKNRITKAGKSAEDSFIELSIGRRLKTELPRENALNLLEKFYGDDWNDETLKSAIFTLQNVYDEDLI